MSDQNFNVPTGDTRPPGKPFKSEDGFFQFSGNDATAAVDVLVDSTDALVSS